METYTFTVYQECQRRSVVTGVIQFKTVDGLLAFYDKDEKIIICFKEWSFFEREV